MITVNMNKAKEIHKKFFRDARKPFLEQLDGEFVRALEQNKDTTEIVAKKQALRDVTVHPDLIAANTIDELRTVWPDVLGEKPSYLEKE